MMAVSREQFEQGMTYEAYKNQMTRNRDRLEETEQTVILDEETVQFFRNLTQPVDGLVLVEDWCGDVIANVPVLARLAQESGKLNLRFLLRDQNLEIMDQYLNQGKHRSIPTLILFDAEFNEIGVWIERPARITQMRAEMMDDLFSSDPALQGVERDTSPAQMPEAARTRVSQASSEFRAQNRALSDREVQREVREIVARSLGNNGAGG